MAKYENSPPPSDFDDEEFENYSLDFTLTRRRCQIAAKYLPIDRSLLGSKKEKEEEGSKNQNVNEISPDADKNINENSNEVEQLNVTANDNSVQIAATDQETTDEKIDSFKRAHEEESNSNKAGDKLPKELDGEEHASTDKKKRKHSE